MGEIMISPKANFMRPNSCVPLKEKSSQDGCIERGTKLPSLTTCAPRILIRPRISWDASGRIRTHGTHGI